MIIFVKFWMCIFLCIDSSESLVSKLYKFLMLSHKQHNAGSFLVEYCVSKPWRILHCCSNSLAFSYPLTGHVIFWFTTLFSRWFCEVFQTKEGPSLLRNVMLSLFLKTAIRAYLVRPQECSDRISIPPLRKKIYKDNKALEKSTTPIERGSKYFAPFPPHCEWLQDFFTSFFLPTTVWLTSRGWSCYDHRPPPPQETWLQQHSAMSVSLWSLQTCMATHQHLLRTWTCHHLPCCLHSPYCPWARHSHSSSPGRILDLLQWCQR